MDRAQKRQTEEFVERKPKYVINREGAVEEKRSKETYGNKRQASHLTRSIHVDFRNATTKCWKTDEQR